MATTYNFDDGTMQGWTLASTDGQGRQFFAVVPPQVGSPNDSPHSGSHFIGLHVPAFSWDEPVYTQDHPHDTLVLRSPEFMLNGSGDLTVRLSGGGQGSPSLAGTSVSALPATSSDGGFRGIALRNMTTGMYLLSASKGSSGNEWEQVGFNASQLSSLPQGDVYTLDLIDAGHGGWGWINMDSVTIPGTEFDGTGSPPPTISSIADQTILANTSTNALPFTVGHSEVDPGTLTLSGSSSNTTLVPNSNIVFGGSGANRNVTVTPAAGRTGTAVITVTVSNGERTASTGFSLRVLTDAQSHNPVPIRVDDMGTGLREALVVPAEELKNTPREFYRHGRSQFGIETSAFNMLYNLKNRDGRQAGFQSIIADHAVVYDQRPFLVLNTNQGNRWTNTWQNEIYEGGIWSSGYYRDFKLRPFSFADYNNAIGSFQYHVFADRILEETRVAHDAGSIGNVNQVYVEYPIAFSSYQVYEGAAMTPVQKTEINSGALIVQRPNGSLFGFTFPQSSVNGKVEIFEHQGQLIVRHYASLNHVESIRENTRIFRWGRRIFAAADYSASRDLILSQMSEELNPLPSSSFSLSILGNNHDFYTQQNEIFENVSYDPIAGYYRYRIDGISWGGSIKDAPFRYPGLRVTVNSQQHRNFFLMQETTSPDNAAVLQDDSGYVLPISIGIARSLGGQGNPDWTGDWTSRDYFMAEFERFAWGRSLFPVHMQPNQTLNFRVLHLVHRWGPNQFIGTGSVVSHVPLFTSTAGVWCVLDLNPWYGSVGDFRGFSSTPTGYAWGEYIPGNEEQFAQALEFTLSSIGDRDRDYQGARNITHNLSNFKIPLHYDIDNGKADLNIVVSALPDTNESRIMVDVEFAINQDIHITQGERIRFIRVMNPFHVLFYNAFWRSTSGDQLQSANITLDPALHAPGGHVQTAILEGSRPAFSLADKRWMGDPHNPNPHDPDQYNFRGVEGNIHVQVFDKEFIINGQPANEQLALRVSKAQPNTNHWHNKNHFHSNEYYISYDLVLERDNFTLRAGDRISLSYMVQPYGGKASDNEIASAQRTHNHYDLPSVTVISGSDVSDPDYPWLPVVRSADGSTAEFTLQGGLDKLTFSVEGLHSWRPVRLFRVNNGHRQEINYRVNGHDGYRSYVDAEGLVGISIPVSMDNGAPVRLVVEQDNSGINPPEAAGPTISSIADQTIVFNTNTGPLSFTFGSQEVAPGTLTLSGSSTNTTLVPNSNIAFGGAGANRTVTVTPATGQLGSSTITIIVSDGERTAGTSFVLNVVSDLPPITFDFGDGTMQGWSVVSTDGQERQFFAVVPPIVHSPNADPHSGSHFIGLHVPAFTLDGSVYTQDSEHDTLLFRSPEFTLNGSGDLGAWLSGGGPGSPSLAGTSVSALPSTSVDGGFRGIALRNVNTGTYVLSGAKTAGGNDWEQVVFTAAQLASLPQDHVYTLDLIDAAHGGWGWVNMDSVTIPGTLVDEPVLPGMPTLAIERFGGQVRLSWPVAASGWTLQRSADAGGQYVDAGLPVSVEGDQNVVYDTILSGRQFYRLIE